MPVFAVHGSSVGFVKALLHRKEGDSVMVQVSPDYSYKAVIRKVEESEDAETASLRNY